MKLSARDKTAVTVGACVLFATVFIAAVVSPLTRGWSDLGNRLRPKLNTAAQLINRVDERDALLVRRSFLIADLGSLVGEASSAGSQPPPDRDRPRTQDNSSGTPKPATDSAVPPVADSHTDEPEPRRSPDPEHHSDNPMTAATGSARPPDPRPAGESAPRAGAPTSDSLSFAAHVERTAKQAKVKIKRYLPKKQPAGAKKYKYFEPVSLQINFDTNLDNFLKFLHELEKGSRLARVERLDLRRDVNKGGNLEVTLDLIGYEPKAR